MSQETAYQQPVLFRKVVTSDREDQAGYQEIYSAGTDSFVGGVAAGVAAATYNIRITVDGTLRSLAIVIAGTETFAAIAALIQTALRTATSKLETVQIVNNKFRVTSTTLGATSSVLIQDGATDGLLAAITALLPAGKYISTIAAASPGREGVVTIQVTPDAPSTKEFYFTAFCVDSANKQKVGLKYSFDQATGFVTISDDVDTVEVKTGDVITLAGVFK